jgi:HK97 family phage portal protein
MGLFFRRRPERRSGFAPMPPYLSAVDTGYADVDVSTMESSLQSIAFRTAVDLVASLVSELPVDVYSGRGGSRQKLSVPSWLEDPAGDGHGREDWLYQVMQSWLVRGNMFGNVVETGPGGFPRTVDLFHPDHVRGHLEDGRPVWYADGQRVDRMWHVRVNPVPGVVLGLSPIQAHAWDLGLNLTLTRFGASYFRDGALPGAILRNEEKEVGQGTANEVKSRFLAAVRGRREPAVMGRGWRYEPINISPEESQFLESRGFTAAEVARIIGPGIPELLGYTQQGSSLTYANLQDRSVHLLVYSLGKWLRRADRLLTAMLPRPQYARLNRDALLETTTLQRFQAHASALTNWWRTINEVRAIEDLPPVPWGDEPYAPSGQPLGLPAAGGQQQDEGGTQS